MQASLAVSMLLLLKKFLREAYHLADDRVAAYAGKAIKHNLLNQC
jgi:hypothetical protein